MTTLIQELEVQQVNAMSAQQAMRSKALCLQGGNRQSSYDRVWHQSQIGDSTENFNDLKNQRSGGRYSDRPGSRSINSGSNSNEVHGCWVLRFVKASFGKGSTNEQFLERRLMELSGDKTVALSYHSEDGLLLKGTKAGFMAIELLFQQGKLSKALETHISSLEWTPDNPVSMGESNARSTSYENVFSQTLPKRTSKAYTPPSIRVIYSNPENPTKFGWIIGHGSDVLSADEFVQAEYRLIDYFSTDLAFKDSDIWVNLSPFEPHRILYHGLKKTRLGRDYVLQDFKLKKYVASLISPTHPLGRDYWMNVSDRSFGNSQAIEKKISLFQKVTIRPTNITYYKGKTSSVKDILKHKGIELERDDDDVICLTNMDLQVSCSADNVALQKFWRNNHLERQSFETVRKLNEDCLEAFQEIILPEVSRELNEGREFSKMRQIMEAWTMASFFKINFSDRPGYSKYIHTENPRELLETRLRCSEKLMEFDRLQKAQSLETPESLYQDYLQLFENGGHRLVKGQFDTDQTPLLMKTYFSGGISVL